MTTLAAAGPAEEGRSNRQAGPIDVSTGVTEAEWDGYLSAHPDATSDHLWGWGRVIDRAFDHRPVYLAARRCGQIVGVLPLVLFDSRVFGRSVTSLPFLNYGGIVADDTDTEAALLAHGVSLARAFGARHLELRHARRQFDHLPCRQHKLALRRSLPATPDALWAETDRKVRNQVRKAQKADLVTVQGGAELLPDFYDVFARNMRDLGTPVYARRFFDEAVRVFPDRTRLTVVRTGPRPVAAAVTVRWRDTVLVPWASSLREYRHLCPNMLLYWTMLEQAVTSGVTTFDFGRSSPGSGPHQFKLQWGARETPLTWEYVLLAREAPPDQGPSNRKLRLAIEAWRRLPLGVANWFGPWIGRQLP